MAKAPIIISNGGMASELTRDLVPAKGASGTAEKIILRNVEELNERKTGPYPIAMSLSEAGSKARIIWRLSNEKEHPHETGAGAR